MHSPEPQGPVLVVDFGAQYAQLIARRVREAHVYSEIVPHTMSVSEIVARKPAAVILSGGPSSVYAEGAPSIDASLFDTGIPVFGICYGFQAMAQALGGVVERTGLAEFGGTKVTVLIDDLDIRVLDHNTGQLIRKLVLDPTRDYQPRGVKCGNSPENRL